MFLFFKIIFPLNLRDDFFVVTVVRERYFSYEQCVESIFL